MQVNIIPVNNDLHLDYCLSIEKLLKDHNIRCKVDTRNEKIGYKMRESQMNKIPHTLVIGDKETNDKTVNYREYSKKETTEISLDDYIKLVEDLKNNRR